MREISPAANADCEEFLNAARPVVRAFVENIRAGKAAGTRPRPSTTLIDRSAIFEFGFRQALLDEAARLVDENLTGRSDMCRQFAELIDLALKDLGVVSRVVAGTGIYYDGQRNKLFQWDHFWVRAGAEVIDGNADSMQENPLVPDVVRPPPYWGAVKQTPSDRRLHEVNGRRVPVDADVINVWWPDLKQWLDARSA